MEAAIQDRNELEEENKKHLNTINLLHEEKKLARKVNRWNYEPTTWRKKLARIVN